MNRILLGLFVVAGPMAAQEIDVVKFDELVHRIGADSGTAYVINFWATWCSPCVKELPHFDRVSREFKTVRVYLVSLDFKSHLESKVRPFIREKNIRSPALLLDETDANSYIDRVSPQWSGAIPATLIVHPQKRKRQFFEREFTYDELVETIRSITQSTER